jgi:hypothetical protein
VRQLGFVPFQPRHVAADHPDVATTCCSSGLVKTKFLEVEINHLNVNQDSDG